MKQPCNTEAGQLSLKAKIGFGVADIGGNLFFTVMGFWSLTYLTDTVYLAPALAGMAIMTAKIWDAVTDPIVGYLSDSTHTRWGRRRPYLLFGALPFGLSVWIFFTNPHIQHQTLLFSWAVGVLCLLNTAMTVVNIPYSALTPELTTDYREQISLNSYRFFCAGLGTIAGAVIIMPIVHSFSSKSAGFSAAGAFAGFIIAVSTLITFFSVKEPVYSIESSKQTVPFSAAYRSVFKNRAYTILLTVFVLHITALNFLQGMIVYYLKYFYQTETFSTTIMGVLLIFALLAIPVAAKCSSVWGKRSTYQMGFAVLGTASLVIFFTGHTIGLSGLTAFFILAGIGVGFAFATPWAMLPDAIAQKKEAVHNEGCYYGIWTFTSKLGQAVSVGFSGLLLSMAGYSPDAVQSAHTLLTIRFIGGPIPAVLCLTAFFLLRYYPTDKESFI